MRKLFRILTNLGNLLLTVSLLSSAFHGYRLNSVVQDVQSAGISCSVFIFGSYGHTSPSSTATADPKTTPPGNPYKNCWMSDEGTLPQPKHPPTPFLYQPFDMAWSGSIWSSNMDHTRPNYKDLQGVAALGEILSDRAPAKFRQWWDNSHRVSYDYYLSPSLEVWLGYDGHDGNDFSTNGETGHSALAAAAGQVVRVQSANVGPLGRYVDIYHAEGYLTRYAHLADVYVSLTDPYTEVSAGQPIGEIGSSGTNTTGIHLHFGVYRWNAAREEWEVTDPFGWDPWLSPGQQVSDPLYHCNGEISYVLWVGGWPQTVDGAPGTATGPFVRSLGGWLGETPSGFAPSDALRTVSMFEGTIFDETGRRFSRRGKNWWEASTGYDGHHWWAKSADIDTAVSATWLLNPTSRGRWEVFVYIPEGATTVQAHYTVSHNGQEETIVVDQSAYRNIWVSLGVFDFAAQGDEYLVLTSNTGEQPGSTTVVFDAVGIQWVDRGQPGLPELPRCFQPACLFLVLALSFTFRQILCREII